MSRIVSLCGNIGSGKSTLVSNLNQNQNSYHVVQEPISENERSIGKILQRFFQMGLSFAMQSTITV